MCCAVSPNAEENLRCIRQQEKLSLLDNCQVIDVERVSLEQPDLLLVDNSGHHGERCVPWKSSPYVIAVGPRRLHKEMGTALNARVFQQKLSHRKLGRLLQATALVFWSGENGHEVQLRSNDYPVRPVDKFVELTVELPSWKTRLEINNRLTWWRAKDKEPF
jgi:hypothetical protein